MDDQSFREKIVSKRSRSIVNIHQTEEATGKKSRDDRKKQVQERHHPQLSIARNSSETGGKRKRLVLDDIRPEYEEPKSPEVRKNRPSELGNKLPSIDGTEQSSSNIKKIANGALVIETR